MNSTKDIARAVKTYVEIPNTLYAIMVDGDWGCGKTHLWKNTIRPLVGEDEALYISLFGLKTIEDIENEIFKAMSFIGENTEGFFKGLLNKSTVDLSDDIKLGGIGFAVQYGMQKWKEIRLKKSKKLFICFDDVERWAGEVSVYLSYINKLVEHDGTKCLIIGNSKRIEDKNKFNLTKDKIIGFKYRLTHSPSDVFEAAFALSTFPNTKTKTMLKNIYINNAARINACLTESKCSNIRIVSTAISYLGNIADRNYDKFKLSQASAVDYFITMLSTVVLVEMYRTSDEDKKSILASEAIDTYELLSRLGINSNEVKDNKELREEDSISENLIYQCYGENKGICSIIKNGFYRDEDFVDEFTGWKNTEFYEIYLDTFKVWYMDDQEAKSLFDKTYNSVFVEKLVTNPNTILRLAGRMTQDIKRGVLGHDFETIKNDFRILLKKLYDSGEVDRVDRIDSSRGPISFENDYCGDLYKETQELNRAYNVNKQKYELSQFWVKLKNDPGSMEDLLDKYLGIEIFEQYKNPEDILNSIESLSNMQLFELTRWMGSSVKEEPDINYSENARILAVALVIEKKYAVKFGVRAGHFKQIARILKNRKTDYDPECIQGTKN